MTDLKKTITLLIGALFIIVVVVGAYGLFFYSMKGKIEGANEVLSRAKDFENTQSRLSRTLAFLKESEIGRQKIDARFIKEHDIALFAEKIETLGPQSGVNLSIESLEPGIDFRKKPVLNFRIKAQGAFANVLRTEELLENFPTKFDITALRLVRLDDNQVASATGSNKTSSPKRVPQWELHATISAVNFIKE